MKNLLQILIFFLLISLTAYPQDINKREKMLESAAFNKLQENLKSNADIPNKLRDRESLHQISDNALAKLVYRNQHSGSYDDGINTENIWIPTFNTEPGNDFLLSEEIRQEWDSTHWVTNGKSTYKYDITNDNLIEKLDLGWDGSGLVNGGKTFYTYDINTNNLIKYWSKVWNESIWENNQMWTITYDENNNPVKQLLQNWYDSNWQDVMRITNTYDENNNRIVMLMESCYDSHWVNTAQEIYYYDENNNQIERLRKKWVESEWVNTNKWFYYYDENNILTGEFHQHYHNSTWNNSQRIYHSYDENNNYVERLRQNWWNSDWVNHAKWTFTYNINNNNLITWLNQRWENSEWENRDKVTYFYLPARSEQKEHMRTDLNKTIEDFQTTQDDIIIESGRENQSLIGVEVLIDEVLHTSDGDLEFTLSHNDISETIIYQAGGDGDNFINTKLTDNGIDSISNGIAPFVGNYKPENPLSPFTYTEPEGTWTLSIYDGVEGNTGTLNSWGLVLIFNSASGIENEVEPWKFELYPNPVVNKFQVSSPRFKVHKATIELYDLNGKKLLEKQIPAGTENFELDVSSLKSGVYFCKIKTEEHSVTKKLIVQK